MQQEPINKQVPISKTNQEQNPKEQSRCSTIIRRQVNVANTKQQASPKKQKKPGTTKHKGAKQTYEFCSSSRSHQAIITKL